ncbi:Imm26 family immunity protein [Pseudomonas sp. WHRI 8519]|uniref:Imm26 family immunity protein n=1 Tax=Pseudomonas sp. WHRI 8519 TaxID=3162567 RepID=UPI0032EE03E1
MSAIQFFGWDKKAKTALRSIKIGDIFCFVINGRGYGVGRIMTRNSLGHVAEIFDVVTQEPNINEIPEKRFARPVILDSYSLFDRKTEGDWRIIAHDLEYQPSVEEPVRFVYGVADNVKLVDIFDNEVPFSGAKASFPLYAPMGDEDIKEFMGV